jgi:hypothetical protein
MLTIHDEQLIHQLEQLAQQENRSVEDLLKSMVAHRNAAHATPTTKPERSDSVKQVRRKIYRLARREWKEMGDEEKAALTDEQLDEQFAYFDEEGIPRLKSEVTPSEPPVGSLAYAAKRAREFNFRSGRPDLASSSRDTLREHFADDLLKRMRDKNATE